MTMPTILVVDDSKFSRSRVIAALTPLGYTIVEAEDGQQGLAAYVQAAPDVLITDLLMPKLDGIGLLRGLKDNGYEVPAIVVSADIQASTRAMCEELGAFGFLNKPFQAAELVSQVLKALEPKLSIGSSI